MCCRENQWLHVWTLGSAWKTGGRGTWKWTDSRSHVKHVILSPAIEVRGLHSNLLQTAPWLISSWVRKSVSHFLHFSPFRLFSPQNSSRVIRTGSVPGSILSSVSAEVSWQNGRVVTHHPRGSYVKCSLYVLVFIAHEQMHLQLQIYQSTLET